MSVGFGPISSQPISSVILDTSFGLTIIVGQAIIEAILSDPILEILATNRYVIAAEISLLPTDKLYVSTFPFISRNIDALANQPFHGTLEGTIRIDTGLSSNQGGFSGFNENISEIALINAEADYDSTPQDFSINGQSIVLSIGALGARNVVDPYNSFVQVAQLSGERMSVNRTRLTIEARDPAQQLLNAPALPETYGGTGGFDGGEDIAGKKRPRGYGVVFNASPTLVIGNLLIWQFSEGGALSVQSVKDGGVALSFFADLATKEALLPLMPPAGSYATCLAEGYIMLGGVNFKQVTIDFTTSTQTTGAIIASIATDQGGLVS